MIYKFFPLIFTHNNIYYQATQVILKITIDF